MIQSNLFNISSDLSEVKILAKHLRDFCSDNKLDEGTAGLLELLLVEATNNIIIHAYENRPNCNIRAQFKIIDSDVFITLTDSGKIYTQNNKSKNNIEVETKDLAEGNWGLELINSIADEINRHRENDSNILTIKKSIHS